MKLSAEGLAFIEREEGVVLHPYRDPVGYWTIGVGHLLSDREKVRGTIVIGGEFIPWREGLTREQVTALLLQDVAWAEKDVEEEVTVALTQHQFDALVSFVFNVGPTNFAASSLLRLLNEGHYDSVHAQLRRWVYANKKKLPGLVTRRAREAQLWRGR